MNYHTEPEMSGSALDINLQLFSIIRTQFKLWTSWSIHGAKLDQNYKVVEY